MGYAKAALKKCPTPGCTNYQMRGRKTCGPCLKSNSDNSRLCHVPGCINHRKRGPGQRYCAGHAGINALEGSHRAKLDDEPPPAHDDSAVRRAAMRFMLGLDSW